MESIKIRSFSEFKEKDFVPRSELTKVKNAIYCKKKKTENQRGSVWVQTPKQNTFSDNFQVHLSHVHHSYCVWFNFLIYMVFTQDNVLEML